MFLNSIDSFDLEYYEHHRSGSNLWLTCAMQRSMSTWHEECWKYWCFTRKGHHRNWRIVPAKPMEFPKGPPNMYAAEIKDRLYV